MLLAHKIQLYPDAAQAEYLRRCIGARRFAYNALLAHFKQEGVKWSKSAAYEFFLREVRQPWMGELTSRAPRNAIDDLHNAFQHFFRRVKARQKPGFPTFHKKGINDGFALREKVKFDVDGRTLRVEKAPGRIKLRQRLRFTGEPRSVTISLRAGKFYAAVLVETEDYVRLDTFRPDEKSAQELGQTTGNLVAPALTVRTNLMSKIRFLGTDYAGQGGAGTVGVDLGVKALATLSTGEAIPANQKLKANLKRLKCRSRNISRKQRGSARRAKAKLSLAKLHKRIADQRNAILHETSDSLTKQFETIVIEDLAVKNMVKNRSLARAINDAGFGSLRRMIEYKAALRGCQVIVAPRFYPSSKTCSVCGVIKEALSLAERVFECGDCGHEIDRDLNAALNLERLDTFRPDAKRTQERGQTTERSGALVPTA